MISMRWTEDGYGIDYETGARYIPVYYESSTNFIRLMHCYTALEKVEGENMSILINPDTEWGKMPRWKRRWSGFKTYTICAFYSLFCPEAVDYVVLNLIKDQFEREGMGERERERRRQNKAVMPLIGPLLDAWDDLPNDVKGDEELKRLSEVIDKISYGMGEGS